MLIIRFDEYLLDKYKCSKTNRINQIRNNELMRIPYFNDKL